MMLTKRHANSRNAALLPSPDELPRNAGRHFADAPEASHGVVARGNVGPAQVEDIELAFAARTLGLDVHALQEVRIPFGVDDDHDFVLACIVLAPDVLGHEQLGKACLAHARCTQDQGMADALAEREADVPLVGFDAMQAW